ncbi:MAG: GntR family transcriptional regulator [Novosphingobium sp.]|nr:GntR family transcriptional regulator [Novosphingobium sp.]
MSESEVPSATDRAKTDRAQTPVPKLSHVVAGRIRGLIGSGALPRGSDLPTETALLKEIGVSRPVLREAFRILEGEGLIRTGRGARNPVVLGPSIRKSAQFTSYLLAEDAVTLGDLHHARLYIEPEIIRNLSGESLSHAVRDLARCMERWGRSEIVTDFHDAIMLSKQFHEVLMQSAANPVMRVICLTIYEISTRTYRAFAEDGPARLDALRLHIPAQIAAYRRLARLLGKGETAAAAAAWNDYIVDVDGMLTRSTLGEWPLTALT